MNELFTTIANSADILIYLLPAVLLLVLVFAVILDRRHRKKANEAEIRAAGDKGEQRATEMILAVMNDGDRLFTNVPVSFKGRKTELDNVIVNRRGVFIIEAKNYRGMLEGTEEDYEWKKVKISPGGNVFEKTVKNPIRQVKRQVYLLSHYLKEQTKHVWISGYVILTEGNSPIKSDYILTDYVDIDEAIHPTSGFQMTATKMAFIENLLGKYKVELEVPA